MFTRYFTLHLATNKKWVVGVHKVFYTTPSYERKVGVHPTGYSTLYSAVKKNWMVDVHKVFYTVHSYEQKVGGRCSKSILHYVQL